MRRVHESRRGRWIVLATGILLAIGCGGGGGDGGGGGGGDPTILPLYAFGLANTNTGAPFQISYSDGPDDFLVALLFPGAGIHGTYDTDVGQYVFDATTLFEVDSDAGPDPLLGMFEIDVTGAIAMPTFGWPSSGGFDVLHGLDVTSVTLGAGGVDISLNGAPATAHSYEEFEDLMELPVPTHQQRASFAWRILLFMHDKINIVGATLGAIDDDLLVTNPIIATCDPYAPTYTPPPGEPDPGTQSFSWHDFNGDGLVSAFDEFTWHFDGCWQNGPDDYDTLWVGGLIDLGLYTEDVVGGVLTRVGFEPQGAVDGGVYFENCIEAETETVGPVVSIFSEWEMDGSFKLAWWAP